MTSDETHDDDDGGHEPGPVDHHLEAGWRALEDNDLATARAKAEAAIAEAPEDAGAHTLAGAVAAADGDFDAAAAAYERAHQIDPEAFEPLYQWAQVLATAGELEEALALMEDALDVAEEEDEYVEALLLKAEIELGLEDEEAAGETLGDLPEVALPHAEDHLRAAECFLELGRLDEAERHFRGALAKDPDYADAWHGLGLVAEDRGDDKARAEAFAKVRALDAKAPPPALSITVEELEAKVDEVLGELPDEMRALLGNVPIVVDDLPSETLVADGLDPRTMGMFAGMPFPEQGVGAPPQLQQIYLFKRNIERGAHDLDDVKDEIRTTLLHEAGHFFALDEEDLADLGLE
jgi:tetratricopeptide (TPR) repeat protein